jgi:hypothetical protein
MVIGGRTAGPDEKRGVLRCFRPPGSAEFPQKNPSQRSGPRGSCARVFGSDTGRSRAMKKLMFLIVLQFSILVFMLNG